MPDISMCLGRDCPVKNECYRYRAIPSEPWQTYSDFDNPIVVRGGTEGQCLYFWPIEGRPVRPLEKKEGQKQD